MKDDLVYIDHILTSISKIRSYTQNMSLTDFANNEMAQDAVIRNVEIVGEATRKISMEMKSRYHEIPWKEMSGMRDKLIHDYFGINIDIVWDVAKKTFQTSFAISKT